MGLLDKVKGKSSKKKEDPKTSEEKSTNANSVAAGENIFASSDDSANAAIQLHELAVKQNSFAGNDGTCSRTNCQCTGLKENLRQFCLHRNRK